MNNPNSKALPCISFAQIYKCNIKSKLEAIDIFLKTTPAPYEPKDISNLLHIGLDDLIYIMHDKKITTLNMVSFFSIVQTSSSYICRLIQRQWEYGPSKHYTPKSIAYIYDLGLDKVCNAFEESGLTHVDSHNINELFEYIYVPIMNG